MRFAINGLMLMSLTLPALSAHASVLDLGVAGDYNVFVFSDFTSHGSDVEGAVAVGGNLNVSSYSINAYNQAVNGNALVVAHNLTYTNGSVSNGNIYAGGSVSTSSFGFSGSYTSTNPVNFASEETYLKSLSTNISQVAQTGTYTTNYGGIQLTASNNASAQVFDISGSAFNASNYINFSGFSAGQTIILNISGASVAFNGGIGTDFNGYNVLFNIYQATSLNVIGGAYGSVLAPLADVTGGSQIRGNVIANSWNASTQVNVGAFKATDVPGLTAVTPVPEAETWAMLLAGIGFVAMIQRRRRYIP